MSIINEWSPFPKNKDWRKKWQEKPKTTPNPNPYDDKKVGEQRLIRKKKVIGIKTNLEI
jgi:hypothetical protein